MSKHNYYKKNHVIDEMNVDRSKYHVRNLIDMDYYKDLDKESKKWLDTFTDEYYNGRFDRHEKSIMLSEDKIMAEYEAIRKNPEQYNQFKKELADLNREKSSKFPKFLENAYVRFCKIVKSQNQEELNKYNKYVKKNYVLPLKLSDYEKPTVLPKQYRTVDPIEFLRDKIKNRYNTLNSQRKQDLLGRDSNESRNALKYVKDKGAEIQESEILDGFMEISPDIKSEKPYNYILAEDFDKAREDGKLDVFVEKMFLSNLSNFAFEVDNNFSDEVEATYIGLKDLHRAGIIEKISYFFNLSVINLSMLTYLTQMKSKGEALNNIKSLDKIFNKIVFMYVKNKSNNKQYKLKIPKEFVK